MFCPICGSAVADGMAACPNCGAPIAAQAPQQTYQQPTYQQPVYQQPMDMNASIAASKGNTAMILGIISLFFGPLFAIISLIFANQSKSYSGGVRNHDAQVGYVCSWICLGFYIAGVVLSILFSIIGVGLLAELSIVPVIAAILI